LSVDPSETPMVDAHRELVTRAYVDSKASSVAYAQEFTESDLSGGYLSVVHNLKAAYKVCNVTVMDENSTQIEPDGIVFDTQDKLTIDLRMLEPITDTWSVVVNTYADVTTPPPVIHTPTYINGTPINGGQLN